MYFDPFPSIGLVLKHACRANFSPSVWGVGSSIQLLNLKWDRRDEVNAWMDFLLANNIFIINNSKLQHSTESTQGCIYWPHIYENKSIWLRRRMILNLWSGISVFLCFTFQKVVHSTEALHRRLHCFLCSSYHIFYLKWGAIPMLYLFIKWLFGVINMHITFDPLGRWKWCFFTFFFWLLFNFFSPFYLKSGRLVSMKWSIGTRKLIGPNHWSH